MGEYVCCHKILDDSRILCCGHRNDGRLGEEEGEEIQKGVGSQVPEEEVCHDPRNHLKSRNKEKELEDTVYIFKSKFTLSYIKCMGKVEEEDHLQPGRKSDRRAMPASSRVTEK